MCVCGFVCWRWIWKCIVSTALKIRLRINEDMSKCALLWVEQRAYFPKFQVRSYIFPLMKIILIQSFIMNVVLLSINFIRNSYSDFWLFGESLSTEKEKFFFSSTNFYLILYMSSLIFGMGQTFMNRWKNIWNICFLFFIKESKILQRDFKCKIAACKFEVFASNQRGK